jgi:anion-transporting  ArsA/GET3 family ATPase
MEEGFRHRAERVLDLLSHPETAFVLVASPRRDVVEEADYFVDKLAEAQIPVQALIVNRMHPHFGDGPPENDRQRAQALAGTALGRLYENRAELRQLADGEEEHVAALLARVSPAPATRVPLLATDVHDLDGLAEVASYVFAP